jgi:hypothetical protein
MEKNGFGPFYRKPFDRKTFDRKPLYRNGHLTERRLTESTFDRKSNVVFHAKQNSNWFGCNNFFDAARRHGKEKLLNHALINILKILSTVDFFYKKKS